MKKLIALSVLLSMYTPFINCHREESSFAGCRESRNKLKSQFKRFYSQYCASIVLSGCVGVVTGGLTKYVEKQCVENPFFGKNLREDISPVALCLLLMGWIVESEFRNDLIAAIQQDLDQYGIGHRKNLMFKTAQLASWLAYYKV